jgi:[protein-PII] uridylyltransferase
VSEDLRELLSARRAPLAARAAGAAAEARGLELGREHAALLDEILGRTFAQAIGSAAEGIALGAVGAYGRGAVALGSDVDLRLLGDDLARAEEAASALLYPLWDAGLSVGHQVVAIADLVAAAQEDLTTATALLDWRHLAGDRRMADELATRARGGIFSPSGLPDFYARLEQEVERRHQRFGGSVYLLEPDVKNGAGGLRDLDVAWWAARARWNAVDFADLVRLGVLVPRQLRAVEEAREVLWRLRNALHARAGRRSDRLSFDEQEALAPLLGYAADDAGLREGVERMMSDFYRAARTVSRFRDHLVLRATPTKRRHRPSSSHLGAGLIAFDGEATVSDHEFLRRDPTIALRLVAAAVAEGLPLRASARNAIIDVCGDAEWTESLRKSPEAAPLFVELCTSTVPTKLRRGTVMRELHDLGLLLAMIPEFSPVVGRVHHDTYHVYTVDVHSVAAVDRLGEVIRGDVVAEPENGEGEGTAWAGSLACRVASELTHPRVLFFATLLHDVGKAIGRRDHSERGAEMAPVILGRLGFSQADVEEVARLILHHLTMYVMATRRDLDDPQTAEELAAVVRDREGLRNLYLLTVADLSTTSPTSMTSWKARMLDELYVVTDRHFREGLHPERAVEERLREVCARAGDGDAELVGRFLGAMPHRYALGNHSRDIAAHARALSAHLAAGRRATVAHVETDGHGLAQLCVIADDRDGLLADLTAVLAGARLIVHGAQIYSCRLDARELALDLFWVQSRGSADLGAVAQKLERDLGDVLAGTRRPDDLVPRRPTEKRRDRGGPFVETRVIADQRASPDHTVLEVFTRDRPGLLYTLASALSRAGVSIRLAKIATEGTRVVDVFYVTEPAGGKLGAERAEAVRAALVAALDPAPAPAELGTRN